VSAFYIEHLTDALFDYVFKSKRITSCWPVDHSLKVYTTQAGHTIIHDTYVFIFRHDGESICWTPLEISNRDLIILRGKIYTMLTDHIVLFPSYLGVF